MCFPGENDVIQCYAMRGIRRALMHDGVSLQHHAFLEFAVARKKLVEMLKYQAGRLIRQETEASQVHAEDGRAEGSSFPCSCQKSSVTAQSYDGVGGQDEIQVPRHGLRHLGSELLLHAQLHVPEKQLSGEAVQSLAHLGFMELRYQANDR
jgi:hypothetical protein